MPLRTSSVPILHRSSFFNLPSESPRGDAASLDHAHVASYQFLRMSSWSSSQMEELRSVTSSRGSGLCRAQSDGELVLLKLAKQLGTGEAKGWRCNGSRRRGKELGMEAKEGKGKEGEELDRDGWRKGYCCNGAEDGVMEGFRGEDGEMYRSIEWRCRGVPLACNEKGCRPLTGTECKKMGLPTTGGSGGHLDGVMEGFMGEDGEMYRSIEWSFRGKPLACNEKGCRPLTGMECRKLGLPTTVGSGSHRTWQNNVGIGGGGGHQTWQNNVGIGGGNADNGSYRCNGAEDGVMEGFRGEDGEIYRSIEWSFSGKPLACNAKGCRPLTGTECRTLGLPTIGGSGGHRTWQNNVGTGDGNSSNGSYRCNGAEDGLMEGFRGEDGEMYRSVEWSCRGEPLACNEKGCRPLTGTECRKLGLLTTGGSGGGGGGHRTLQNNVGSGGGNDNNGSSSHSHSQEAYYQNLLKSHPQNPLLLSNYAHFLLQQKGDFQRSEEYYGRAILADPNDGDVLSQYAQLQWNVHGDKDRAEAYYDQAIQAAPEDCYVMASYASFLWDTEENDDGNSTIPSTPPLQHEEVSPLPTPLLASA